MQVSTVTMPSALLLCDVRVSIGLHLHNQISDIERLAGEGVKTSEISARNVSRTLNKGVRRRKSTWMHLWICGAPLIYI